MGQVTFADKEPGSNRPPKCESSGLTEEQQAVIQLLSDTLLKGKMPSPASSKSPRDYSPASSPWNSSRSPSSGRGCYNCGQPGHFARECSQPQKCFTCSGKGHTSADCPVGARDRPTSPTRKYESESESWLGESVRQFVFQDSGGDTMLVPVGINGTSISAVVDTAAQVTVMNLETPQTLGLVESSSSEVVQLRNTQKQSVMSGRLWKHVGLHLGGRKYYLDIVEADINDSFILGMDFLQQHHCKILLRQTSTTLSF